HFDGQVRISLPLHANTSPERIALEKLDSVRYEMHDGWPNVWYAGQMTAERSKRTLGHSWIQQVLRAQAEGRGTAVTEVVEVTSSENTRNASVDTITDKNGAGVQLVFSASAGTPYVFTKYVNAFSSHEGGGT